ncbi:MAG: hypothetical protein ISR77_19935 [Pirellulaceae bacterium]|nr:hypothetical protein [Pirellulaceae bacterium]
MKKFHLAAASCLALILSSLSPAQESPQEPPQVLVTDSGVSTVTIGPGAPRHTIGLQGHRHAIVMGTGARTYALRYAVALDPNDPQAAIPGEGYIGMPQPSDQNWYAGGFFDLRLNGKSIGGKLIHSLTGRSSEGRGTADFVFDASQAVVRVRFVAKVGGDCVYAQALFEPKQAITSVQVATRCYPSGFTQDGRRHVQTAKRDFAQGDRAVLDVENEWWTLYYDRVYDAGYIGTTRTGVGPCAMLWIPSQSEKVGFTVGSYGIETVIDLKPAQRDFRFVFFDYAGKKNEAAKADLRGRAQTLLEELTTFAFSDPSLANWPLSQKQAEIQQVLASVPEDKEAVAQYERWGRELAAQVNLVRSGSAGAIMAEANAATIISQWERGLPALKLKALLNRI